jgi:hypothetical protein
VRADDTLSSLIDAVDGVREEDRAAGRPPQLVLKKLSRALEEFGTYIDNNAGAIVNYGERRRCGERKLIGGNRAAQMARRLRRPQPTTVRKSGEYVPLRRLFDLGTQARRGPKMAGPLGPVFGVGNGCEQLPLWHALAEPLLELDGRRRRGRA